MLFGKGGQIESHCEMTGLWEVYSSYLQLVTNSSKCKRSGWTGYHNESIQSGPSGIATKKQRGGVAPVAVGQWQ
jgi:hypothetical protein